VKIIFLDIDGVLNSQLFYEKRYKLSKKQLEEFPLDRYKNDICPERMKWLSELCNDTGAVVVISSSWRSNKTVEELQKIMDYCGGNFKIIDKTPHINHSYSRGLEIKNWIDLNSHIKIDNYAIIDDDSDMLILQQHHFFQTDNYVGLTPTICYKIERFFNGII